MGFHSMPAIVTHPRPLNKKARAVKTKTKRKKYSFTTVFSGVSHVTAVPSFDSAQLLRHIALGHVTSLPLFTS